MLTSSVFLCTVLYLVHNVDLYLALILSWVVHYQNMWLENAMRIPCLSTLNVKFLPSCNFVQICIIVILYETQRYTSWVRLSATASLFSPHNI